MLGRDDLDWHTPAIIEWLKKEGEALLAEAQRRFAGTHFIRDVNYFTLESALCNNNRKKRRSPNVYNDIFFGQIRDAEEQWGSGKDFSVFWKARKKLLPKQLRLEDNPNGPGLKVVAIGGAPGSGKTALMRAWMQNWARQTRSVWDKKYSDVKLVPFMQSGNLVVLGKYDEDEVFGGTDQISMAAQPRAVEFLEHWSKCECSPTIIFEGDRLFNASFLEHCVDRYDTTILYLDTDRGLREQRYKSRGSHQSPTWLAGRESKISNVLSNLTLQEHIVKMKNNSLRDQQVVIDWLTGLVLGSGPGLWHSPSLGVLSRLSSS